jgi:hypothetical protein
MVLRIFHITGYISVQELCTDGLGKRLLRSLSIVIDIHKTPHTDMHLTERQEGCLCHKRQQDKDLSSIEKDEYVR